MGHYTPARKDYIHKFLLSELISCNLTYQLHVNIFLELISRKNTLHVFFCDSEDDMEKLFANSFLGNPSFRLYKSYVLFSPLCGCQ